MPNQSHFFETRFQVKTGQSIRASLYLTGGVNLYIIGRNPEFGQKEALEMPEEICPVCGCDIGENRYQRDGIVYCCEPCATGGACECGCFNIPIPEEGEGGGEGG